MESTTGEENRVGERERERELTTAEENGAGGRGN